MKCLRNQNPGIEKPVSEIDHKTATATKLVNNGFDTLTFFLLS